MRDPMARVAVSLVAMLLPALAAAQPARLVYEG